MTRPPVIFSPKLNKTLILFNYNPLKPHVSFVQEA